MIFGSRMQNLSMYKNNNTGNDIAAELLSFTQSSGMRRNMTADEPNLLGASDFSLSDVDDSRYLFNNAHLATVNHLYKPSKPVDIRLQISAMHDASKSDYSSATSYFYPGQTVVVNEKQSTAGQQNKLDGEFTFQLNDTSLFLKNTFSGMAGLEKSYLDLIVNDDRVTEHIRPQRKVFGTALK